MHLLTHSAQKDLICISVDLQVIYNCVHIHVDLHVHVHISVDLHVHAVHVQV